MPELSKEEIEIRLKKLIKNDPSFPEVILPEWLPSFVCEVVNNFCMFVKASQNAPYRAFGRDDYSIPIYKILPAFTNESTETYGKTVS